MTKTQKTKTEKVAKYMPLMYLIPLILFVISAAVIIIIKENNKKVSPDEIVAKVNGYSITAQELSDRMEAEKSFIIEKYGENKKINDDFWESEIDGVTLLSKLQDHTLEILTKFKVEQQIAVENKIIDKSNTTYASIIKLMENENNSRSQKIANSQPVYGVKKYTKTSFFTYYYSNLQIDNKNKLGSTGGTLYTNDKDLRAWYESVKVEKYKAFDNYDLTLYTISKAENSDAYTIMKNLKSSLENKRDFNYIKNNISNDILKNDTLVNDENASDLQKNSYLAFEEIQKLKTGDISELIDENGSILVVVCNKRSDGGFKSFKAYKSAIYNEYIAEKYDEYVLDKVKSAKVVKLEKFEYVKP